MTGYLLLEDGSVFEGQAAGGVKTVYGELYCHTQMAGYEKLLTDPANGGQIMVMSYPILGSYGMKASDYGDCTVFPKAVIAKEFSLHPSHFECEQTVLEFFERAGIFGFSHIDTRELCLKIRDFGSMKALLKAAPIAENDLEELKTREIPDDVVRRSSVKQYAYINGQNSRNVGIVDLGASKSLVAQVKALGCNIHLFPFDTASGEILNKNVDVVIYSHGGGGISPLEATIQQAKKLIQSQKVCGVGLGAAALAKAVDCDIYKMPNGHRGANYPVLDHKTGKVMITEQNMGYALVKEALEKDIEITHTNINDGTVEGFQWKGCQGICFSPQPDLVTGAHSHILMQWTGAGEYA